MTEFDAATLELRPFQMEAVKRFFTEGSPLTQVLLAPLGTGKGTTASAIVMEALSRGAAGVAVLATRNVIAQGIAWRAASFGLTPFELHRAVAMSTSTSPRWRDPGGSVRCL